MFAADITTSASIGEDYIRCLEGMQTYWRSKLLWSAAPFIVAGTRQKTKRQGC